MKQILAIIAVIILVILGVFLYQNRNNLFTQNNGRPTVTIGGQTFNVTVAKTEQEKVIGLSKKNSLAQDQAMLFPFSKPDYYGFWMKNMKFPLDIIFIRDNKIVTIVNDLKPPTANQVLPIFKPVQPADNILEINAGLSRKYNFKVGDSVQISL